MNLHLHIVPFALTYSAISFHYNTVIMILIILYESQVGPVAQSV
jgi:hypothetical protein